MEVPTTSPITQHPIEIEIENKIKCAGYRCKLFKEVGKHSCTIFVSRDRSPLNVYHLYDMLNDLGFEVIGNKRQSSCIISLDLLRYTPTIEKNDD